MRACKECGAEIAANTSEIYLPEAVNPRHAEPGQPFYFERCPKCSEKRTGCKIEGATLSSPNAVLRGDCPGKDK